MNRDHHHSHAAHAARSKPTLDEIPLSQRPSQILDPDSPQVRELLEELDDAIFTALGGCPEALALTHQLWPETLRQLGWQLVEESSEQYLRFAIDIMCQLEAGQTRPGQHTIAALEIISLLVEE